MSRARLPDRRVCFAVDFERRRIAATFTVAFALDDAGRCAEIFLNCQPTLGDLEKDIRDAAILASLALQHGATLEALISSITHEEDGAASSIVGAALMLVQDEIRRLNGDDPVSGDIGTSPSSGPGSAASNGTAAGRAPRQQIDEVPA